MRLSRVEDVYSQLEPCLLPRYCRPIVLREFLKSRLSYSLQYGRNFPLYSWKIVTLGGVNRDAGLGEFLVLSRRRADIAGGVDLATGRVLDADLRGSMRRSS